MWARVSGSLLVDNAKSAAGVRLWRNEASSVSVVDPTGVGLFGRGKPGTSP